MKEVSLYFANGLFIKAKSFGKSGSFVGEAVFNTSMSGYQEILTDPSYAGQFVIFSMPEIGIVGSNALDSESKNVGATGIIVRYYNDFVSNFRAQNTLSKYCKSRGIMGICGVDTREIIKMLTNEGSMMMIASTRLHTREALADKLTYSPPIQKLDLIKEVSTTKPYKHEHSIFDFTTFDYAKPQKSKAKIIAIDFGIKHNILNELVAVGLEVEVVPHNVKADEIIARFKNNEIQGVFLSNGPGDPLKLTNEIKEIKKLINTNIPIFGICLGHQLLSIAHGYPTHKLKFGHHGGNHPIKNLKNNTIEITAQNHNYCIPESIANIAKITHRNLFDNTIEGVCYYNKPIFSIQYHPEASPGPKEARILFEEFARICTL